MRVLPDGCTDLMLVGGRLLVAGPDTTAAIVESAADEYHAVRLAPGLAEVAFGIGADQLRNSRVELSEVWPARKAGQLLAEAMLSANPIAVLERSLAERLEGRPRWTGFVVSEARSARPVASIAAGLGWSVRKLHRECLRSFGYGPAVLGRVLRFQRAMDLACAGAPLIEVAIRAGYADQPHLAREARSLAGATMTELLAERDYCSGQ